MAPSKGGGKRRVHSLIRRGREGWERGREGLGEGFIRGREGMASHNRRILQSIKAGHQRYTFPLPLKAVKHLQTSLDLQLQYIGPFSINYVVYFPPEDEV